MDQSNCSQGYATDHVFLYEGDFVPFKCDVPLAFYVTFFVILCLVRGSIAVLQLQIWRYRLKKEKERKMRKRNRLPIVPTMSFLSLAAHVLFTILTSTNAANASNGVPGFLLVFLYTPLIIGFQLHFDRIIRLGKRLLPLSKVTQPDQHGNDLTQRLANLSEATRFLRLIKYTMPITGVVAGGSFLAGLIRPVFLTYQIGSAAYAIPDVVLPIGVFAQYQRLILVTRECKKFSPLQIGSQRHPLDEAILRFKLNQAFYIVLGPIMAMIWLITTCRIVPARYWFAMLYFGVEALTMGYMTMINMPREWLSFTGTSKVTTDEDTDQVIVTPATGSMTEMTSKQWPTGNDSVADFGSTSIKADRTTSG